MKDNNIYSNWFTLPSLTIYCIFFLIPIILSFFYSLTIWTLTSYQFVGLDNFKTFFTESYFLTGMKNTLIFGFLTSLGKVVIGFILALYLRSSNKNKRILRGIIFFPTMINALAIGLTFSSIMHPTNGLLNRLLHFIGLTGQDWLGNPKLALYSVVIAEIWRDVGIGMMIFISAINSIPTSYFEVAKLEGASNFQQIKDIIIPLCKPSINIVIVLSFIGGMRTFEMIWAMTRGGPGFASDVLASIIYKQYQSGFYGLSIAGNVVMLIMISIIGIPLYKKLIEKEDSMI